MFTLHVLGQCKDQLYGFTIHLYEIFSEVSLILDIASLPDLQKLVGTSAVLFADFNLKTCPELH